MRFGVTDLEPLHFWNSEIAQGFHASRLNSRRCIFLPKQTALAAMRKPSISRPGDKRESRLRKFEQVDKWSFCLTAGTLVPAKSGATMSRRARRNHTPAFKAKVALAAVWRTKIFRAADSFMRGDVRDHVVSSKIDHGPP